jgi:hypothetical protein
MVDMAALRGFVLEKNLELYGVPGAVTVGHKAAVSTTVVWLTPNRRRASDEIYQFENELDRRQSERRVLAIPLEGLDPITIGTIVSAPLTATGTATRWQVETIERIEEGHTRVIVVPID